MSCESTDMAGEISEYRWFSTGTCYTPQCPNIICQEPGTALFSLKMTSIASIAVRIIILNVD